MPVLLHVASSRCRAVHDMDMACRCRPGNNGQTSSIYKLGIRRKLSRQLNLLELLPALAAKVAFSLAPALNIKMLDAVSL